jgi:hypothetical protein
VSLSWYDPDEGEPMAVRDEIKVPQLVQLYDFWGSKRRGRRYPSREDIDPAEMKFALGNIDLVEVSGNPVVFRFRVSGSAIDADEGFNMQGKTLNEYPLPEHREALRKTYLEALSSGEPNYEELDRLNEGKHVRYARLILPLSNDGTRINMLLMGRFSLTTDRRRRG